MAPAGFEPWAGVRIVDADGQELADSAWISEPDHSVVRGKPFNNRLSTLAPAAALSYGFDEPKAMCGRNVMARRRRSNCGNYIAHARLDAS